VDCKLGDFNGKSYYNGTLGKKSDEVQQDIPRFQHEQLAYLAQQREEKVPDPQDPGPALPALEADTGEEPQIDDAQDAGSAAPVLGSSPTPPAPLPSEEVAVEEEEEKKESPEPPAQLQTQVSVPAAKQDSPTPVVSVAPAVDVVPAAQVQIKVEHSCELITDVPWRLDFSNNRRLIDPPSEDENLEERERQDDDPGFIRAEVMLRDEYGRHLPVADPAIARRGPATRVYERVSRGRVRFKSLD